MESTDYEGLPVVRRPPSAPHSSLARTGLVSEPRTKKQLGNFPCLHIHLSMYIAPSATIQTCRRQKRTFPKRRAREDQAKSRVETGQQMEQRQVKGEARPSPRTVMELIVQQRGQGQGLGLLLQLLCVAPESGEHDWRYREDWDISQGDTGECGGNF